MAIALRLYELTDEWYSIEDQLIENGGELTPEIEAALDQVEGAVKDKADSICGLIQQLQHQADGAAAEAARLMELARVRKNATERLKDYLKENLKKVHMSKVETDRFRVNVVRNSRPSIELAEEATIPDKWLRVTFDLDGQQAYEDLKAAGKLPAAVGVVEVDGLKVTLKDHLRIK